MGFRSIKNRQRLRLSAEGGFTLIEMTITIVIIGLAASVAIPTVSSMTTVNLRSSAGKLAGTMRAAYDNAALTGQTYRVRLKATTSKVLVEHTADPVAVDGQSNALVAGSKAMTQDSSGAGIFALMGGELPGAGDDDDYEPPTPSALQALLGVNKLDLGGDQTNFQNTEHSFGLDDGVHVLSVWVEGMRKPENEGEVSVTFFPGGYAQDAIIHLESEGGAVYSVLVDGLTGRSKTVPEYVEVPK